MKKYFIYLFLFVIMLNISFGVVLINPKQYGNFSYNIANQTNIYDSNISIQYGKNISFLPINLDSNGVQNINIRSLSTVTLNVSTQQIIDASNSTGLLINWNSSGFIKDWSYLSATGGNTTQEMITAVNTTGLLINWSNYFIDTYNTSQEMIIAVNYTGLLINWNSSGYIKDWSYIDTNDTTRVIALELGLSNNVTKLNNLQTSFEANVTKIDYTWTSLLSNVTKIDNLYQSFLNNVTKININSIRIDTINSTIQGLKLGNTTQEMITTVNTTGLLINWNSSGFIKDWSYIDTDTDTYNTTQEMITAVNTTGFLINWSNVISPVAGGGNSTQEMISAVNGTYLTMPKINIGDAYFTGELYTTNISGLSTLLSNIVVTNGYWDVFNINDDVDLGINVSGRFDATADVGNFGLYLNGVSMAKFDLDGNVIASNFVCDGSNNCLHNLTVGNTTQEMINAVNGTYLTMPKINITDRAYIKTWCIYENATGSLVFERNC